VAEKKGRGKIASLVEEIIREPVEQAGYLLWDVDFYKEGADFNLLVTIENPGREKPIDLEDCERVTHLIDPILDEADPIAESYYLEVSSAGLERELVRPEHFEMYIGKAVSLRLYAPVNGKKAYTGILLARGDEGITIRSDGGDELTFKKEAVAQVTTIYENI
jgi:ribosome maturation factor RimP